MNGSNSGKGISLSVGVWKVCLGWGKNVSAFQFSLGVVGNIDRVKRVDL